VANVERPCLEVVLRLGAKALYPEVLLNEYSLRWSQEGFDRLLKEYLETWMWSSYQEWLNLNRRSEDVLCNVSAVGA